MTLRFDDYVDVLVFEDRTKEEVERLVRKTIDEFGLDIPGFRADRTARNMVRYMLNEIEKYVGKNTK